MKRNEILKNGAEIKCKINGAEMKFLLSATFVFGKVFVFVYMF